MKVALLIIFVTILALNNTMAQNSANTSASINITLIRGLTIETSGTGSLDFGDLVVAQQSQNSGLTNSQGQQFKVTGHPGRTVVVTYNESVILNNDAWVTANGGINSTIEFISNIADQTGSSSTYTNPTPLPSGSLVSLVNNQSIGELNVWIGGSVNVPANHPHGSYEGDLEVNVAY